MRYILYGSLKYRIKLSVIVMIAYVFAFFSLHVYFALKRENKKLNDTKYIHIQEDEVVEENENEVSGSATKWSSVERGSVEQGGGRGGRFERYIDYQ